jgi:hypothetical protein
VNKEELTIGFIFGLCFSPIIGWYALCLAPATSWLWAKSGAPNSNKFYRRIGVPLLTAAFTGLWWSIPGAWALLSMGYGIPSTQPPDEGSTLGKFWFKVCGGSEKLAHIATRSTIYILLATNYLVSMYVIKGT